LFHLCFVWFGFNPVYECLKVRALIWEYYVIILRCFYILALL
jgi:hypothetical protein